jgi:hypothetical protein
MNEIMNEKLVARFMKEEGITENTGKAPDTNNKFQSFRPDFPKSIESKISCEKNRSDMAF